jgi:hypothetical protein
MSNYQQGGGCMKRFLSIAIISTLVAGMLISGCEKKSDSEKAWDGLKKDVKSATK